MSDISVMIVEDHPVVASGIADLLETSLGITVAGKVGNGQQALEMIEDLKPDLVLLDMELPDINGVDVITEINNRGLEVKILGLSSYDDREYVAELLSMGAAGYLTKDEAPEMIVEAVRGIARGETGWVSRSIAARLTRMMQDTRDKNTNLTPRELQVLRHLVKGKTNAEISLSLGISTKTVGKHLSSIYKKMDVSSRVDAAVQAVRDQIV